MGSGFFFSRSLSSGSDILWWKSFCLASLWFRFFKSVTLLHEWFQETAKNEKFWCFGGHFCVQNSWLWRYDSYKLWLKWLFGRRICQSYPDWVVDSETFFEYDFLMPVQRLLLITRSIGHDCHILIVVFLKFCYPKCLVKKLRNLNQKALLVPQWLWVKEDYSL